MVRFMNPIPTQMEYPKDPVQLFSLFHSTIDPKQSGKNFTGKIKLLNNLRHWAISKGLNCVHSCRKRNCTKLSNLSENNTESHKFLGLYFDSTWKAHINYIKIKCNKDLNILKMLSILKWGSHRTSLLQFYKILILPKQDYECKNIKTTLSEKILSCIQDQHRCQ